MNRTAVWPTLLAGVMGVVIGFLIGERFDASRNVVPSAVLDDFSFATFIARVDSSEWHVIEDRIYDPLPPLGRSPQIGRRVVAQSALPASNQNEFAARFQGAAEKWITSRGAMIKGQQNATRVVSEEVIDGEVSTLIDLPRRYYAIGPMNGVADFGCVAHSGAVTIIISINEAP